MVNPSITASLVLPFRAVLFLGLGLLGSSAKGQLAGDPLWIYDSLLHVNHVETADLTGDGTPDVIGAEYSNNHFDEPSRVYAVDGQSGATLWTYLLQDGVRSMTLGDLNQDGVQDVIAGASAGTTTVDGRVHAIDGVTGTSLWTFPVGATIQDVTLGRLNPDAVPDVVLGSFDDRVYAIDGSSGALLWSRLIGSLWVNAVDCEDVDGDGIDDVGYAHEFLTGFDNFFGVLDGENGNPIWSLTVPTLALDVLLEDIDQDGTVEAIYGLVSGANLGTVEVRNGLTGALEWQYDLGNLDRTNGDIHLRCHDLDQDLDRDLVVANFLGVPQIFAFDGGSNTPMWMSEALNSTVRDLAFGDVVGGGSVQVLAATSDRVQVVDGTSGLKTWAYSVAGSISSVAAGDFDGDGTLDVAASGSAEASGFPPDPAKSIWALETADSPVLWEFDFGEYGNALSLGALNGDSALDVVTVSSLIDQAVAIDGATGTELWRWTGTENLYAVAMGDFDDDDQLDVVVAGNDDTVTAIDGATGLTQWQFTTPGDQVYRKNLQVHDLDGDGADDVLAGSDDETIYAIDGPTGLVLWSVDVGGDVEEVELAQMNGVGPADVVLAVGFPGYRMAVLDGSDGSLLWEVTGMTNIRHVEVLDADDDGVPDVGVATSNQILVVDGVSRTSFWSSSFDANVDYGLSHGDLEGDGPEELIAAGDSGDRSVHAFAGATGNLLWSHLTGGDVNVVRVADVNRDGNPEVIAGSDDQILYVLEGLSGAPVFTYSTVGDVMHLQVGDVDGDGRDNLACVTFDNDGVVYVFRELTTEIEVDDAGPAFSIVQGTWQSVGFAGACGGTLFYRRGGTGANRAAFRLDRVGGQPFLTPGTYDVFAKKVDHPRLNLMATNAPFRVFDKNGPSPWVRLDQSVPGSDPQLIGTFEFDNAAPQGVLVSDDADGFVIVDGILLVPR